MLLGLVPGLPRDWELLMRAFPPVARQTEQVVVAHLAVLMEEMWDTIKIFRHQHGGSWRPS